MTDNNITRKEELTRILKMWAEFYKDPTLKLVNHLRAKRYSDQQIANILQVSRQAVQQGYPKEVNK